MSRPILEARRLTKVFNSGGGFLAKMFGKPTIAVRAVQDVNFSLKANEVLGLVGESGCGKSTLGRVLAGLLPSTSGDVLLGGVRSTSFSRAERRDWARSVQMIFQNPYASLNPRRTVRQSIEEPLRVHAMVPDSELGSKAEELLMMVGLKPEFGARLPHQLSGGQYQRVGIARAITVSPKVLICDEPVSALDVSIQAQILNLFADLRERMQIAYVFISHDLGVVERLSDRVAVMYLGRIVEMAERQDLFDAPKHPYTIALLQAVPKIGKKGRKIDLVAGERPSPLNPPAGCHFHPRCPHAMARCRTEAPALKRGEDGRYTACHLVE
ncbi:MAG: ATP-binding cassette domain-containing protein [Alphaproteobacteria bacterium]|nr:ATP-binding cassette domain-containing protein [Alphaproteobacteria bacterium]